MFLYLAFYVFQMWCLCTAVDTLDTGIAFCTMVKDCFMVKVLNSFII